MSNAVNFNDMPVNYGLLYAFDCNTYVDGAASWDNSVSGGTAATVVGGTKYIDESVLLAKGSFAYWVNSDSYTDCTKYFVGKALNTPSDDINHYVFTERAASWLFTTDLCVYNEQLYSMGASGEKVVTSILSTDYHIIAISKSGTTATIYIDGVEISQLTGKDAFTPTNYGINVVSTTGNTPTANYSYHDVYVKCAMVCKAAHSGYEIQQNSDWLLEQYGLKAPEKDSRLAGTDAVAIAYVIARNQESAAALQELKKAYRDGTVNGDDGKGDVTEPYTTTNPDEPMPFPKDGESTVNTDDAITDLTKGYWFACGDRDTETVNYYVKVWIEPYYESSNSYTCRNKIWAAIYLSDGTQLGNPTYCEYQYFRSYDGNTETATRAVISGKALLIYRWVTHSGGFEQATVCSLLGSGSLGAIVWSGNVSPF